MKRLRVLILIRKDCALIRIRDTLGVQPMLNCLVGRLPDRRRAW